VQEKVPDEYNDVVRFLRFFNREKWVIFTLCVLGICLSTLMFYFTSSNKQKIVAKASYKITSTMELNRLPELLNNNPIDYEWLSSLSPEDRMLFSLPFGTCLNEPGSKECLQEKIGLRGARIVDGKLVTEWQLNAVNEEDVRAMLSIFGPRLQMLVNDLNSTFNERANSVQEASRLLFESQIKYSSVVNEIYDELKKFGSPATSDSLTFGQNPLQGLDGSFLLLARLEKSRNAESKDLRQRLLTALVSLEDARSRMLRANQALQKAFDPIFIKNLDPEITVSKLDTKILRPLLIFIVFGAFTGIGLSIIYLAIRFLASLVNNSRKASSRS
jgi:hypothetical protein